MTAKVFAWDWRQQPPMEDIAATVCALSGGRVHMAAVPTGTDEYAWIVADHEVSDEEAEQLWEART